VLAVREHTEKAADHCADCVYVNSSSQGWDKAENCAGQYGASQGKRRYHSRSVNDGSSRLHLETPNARRIILIYVNAQTRMTAKYCIQDAPGSY
jgi:hypothetical protein